MTEISFVHKTLKSYKILFSDLTIVGLFEKQDSSKILQIEGNYEPSILEIFILKMFHFT